MSIKNYDQIKTLIDIGMEKGYLTPDEINDFLPQNIFSPEDIEDIFDFLSESNIDVVDTMKEKIETPEEEQREWEEERSGFPRKDGQHHLGLPEGYRRISLLSAEEEYDIAKRIEEGESKIRACSSICPWPLPNCRNLRLRSRRNGQYHRYHQEH